MYVTVHYLHRSEGVCTAGSRFNERADAPALAEGAPFCPAAVHIGLPRLQRGGYWIPRAQDPEGGLPTATLFRKELEICNKRQEGPVREAVSRPVPCPTHCPLL